MKSACLFLKHLDYPTIELSFIKESVLLKLECEVQCISEGYFCMNSVAVYFIWKYQKCLFKLIFNFSAHPGLQQLMHLHFL